MAQTSIASFFKKQPPAVLGSIQNVLTPTNATPIAKKRTRSTSSDASDAENNNTENINTLNKKSPKQHRAMSPEQEAIIANKKKEALAKLAARKSSVLTDSAVPSGGLASLLQEPGWKAALAPEMNKPYFKQLDKFVTRQYDTNPVYPPRQDVFNAFDLCPLENTKVVILGQDPYHGPGQAHGLSFSVKDDIRLPPSLNNIYKEITSDLGHAKPSHGNLTAWASQGVLLLNTVLTVQRGKPNSHKNQGWEEFTDAVIKVLNKSQTNVVFLLWGRPSQMKSKMLNPNKHLIITSSHPSPLGATKTNKPFIGSKCFSRTNEYLKKHGKEPINWKL